MCLNGGMNVVILLTEDCILMDCILVSTDLVQGRTRNCSFIVNQLAVKAASSGAR